VLTPPRPHPPPPPPLPYRVDATIVLLAQLHMYARMQGVTVAASSLRTVHFHYVPWTRSVNGSPQCGDVSLAAADDNGVVVADAGHAIAASSVEIDSCSCAACERWDMHKRDAICRERLDGDRLNDKPIAGSMSCL
jgi:hypothetical protein